MSDLKKMMILLFFVLLCSCVSRTALVQKDAEGKIFWPGPPEETKIKYLWSLSVVEAMGEGSRKGILDFILGDIDYSITDPRTSNTLLRPYSLFIDDIKNDLYVSDPGAMRVTVVNLKDLGSRQLFGPPDSEFQFPVGVVADSEGRIYVADAVLKKVFVLDTKGELISEIKNNFLRPTCLAIDNSRGRLYITDTLAHKVYVLTLNGEMLFDIGGQGFLDGEFNFPTHLWVDNRGYLFVSDSMNFRVQIFDEKGKFYKKFGTLGDSYADLEKPKGVATDSDGNIYVVDSINDTIKIYDEKGLLLLFFGEKGLDYGQFWLPSGLFIDSDDIIYVADTYNMRVQAFQYLKD